MAQSFEDLIVWRKSMDFAVTVHTTAHHIQDAELRTHLLQASLAVSSRIAGGHATGNSLEFSKHLQQALSELMVSRSMLYLVERIQPSIPIPFASLHSDAAALSSQLLALNFRLKENRKKARSKQKEAAATAAS
jgi:four helix bundle protein